MPALLHGVFLLHFLRRASAALGLLRRAAALAPAGALNLLALLLVVVYIDVRLYKSTNAAQSSGACASRCPQFTCFTSTKVQTLRLSPAGVLNFLALLVQ